MKTQWYLLAGILFTIFVSVFAVLNVAPVEVNFLFGTAEWPLVLVILFSTLMGIIIAGSIGIYQVVMTRRKFEQKHKNSNTTKTYTSENTKTGASHERKHKLK
ncbi:LapA family protein [Sutcliffiella rhizosphaerae]|uniref:Lipopolysaccharide assembly protein A domain-containing protein n=1 Tax=Sutcliffiella rhizosphaerae TaxID=2880967 RepID=A0ABN8A807_9BACI|nr:lipopolysaccharide assembly protein LapA domain-containing protein [Sutcliffiella rhizosphaerae]CAG9619462.1 hypothetical protein BACCIP111883_00229 [Sutcliffiella rhizosphaerae]